MEERELSGHPWQGRCDPAIFMDEAVRSNLIHRFSGMP